MIISLKKKPTPKNSIGIFFGILLILSVFYVPSKSEIEHKYYYPLFIKSYPVKIGFKGVCGASQWEKDGRYFSCDAICELGIETYYTYTPNPPSCVCDGKIIEAVPMLFGPEQVGLPLAGNSERLLLFNEPEILGIGPEDTSKGLYDAKSLYPSKRKSLPGVYHFSYIPLLWQFYKLRYGESPDVDYVAIHIYPQGWTLENAKRETIEKVGKASRFAKKYGLRVLVTEIMYATCMPGCDERCTEKYMEWVIPYLHEHPLVDSVYWFPLTSQKNEPWLQEKMARFQSFGSCTANLIDFWNSELTRYGERYKRL